LVGKPKGKRPLERGRLRLEDSIEIYFSKMGLDGVDPFPMIHTGVRMVQNHSGSINADHFFTS
jgi:hypothetical protein